MQNQKTTMKIVRALRSIQFFHEGTELKFDDIRVSVDPKIAIGQTFCPEKSHLFDISFDEIVEELGDSIVVVTLKKQVIEERYSPFIIRESGEKYTTKHWFYGFTSYFATGTLSLVPSIHVEGTVESREELGLEVGKTYKVSLRQHEREKNAENKTE